jgi:methionine aminotransferase
MISYNPNIQIELSIYGEMRAIAQEYNAIDMTQGVASFVTPEWLVDSLYFYAKKGCNTYSPVPGTPELRKACAHKIKQAYDVEVRIDETLITCSATEAIFATLFAYVMPGDEVIYFDPAWDVYPAATALVGGISRRLSLLGNGHIDIDAIARSINDKTKIILLNSPHNPVGSVVTYDEYEQISKLVEGKDILILSDEVYEHMYAGERFISALQIEGLRDKLVVFQSFGKTYNLTGWRIGACIAPEKILKPIQAIKQNITFSAPTPMQLAIADGINNHPEYWMDLPKLYQQKHAYIASMIKNSRFKINPWQGSPFIILNYTQINDKPDKEYAVELIKEHGIGLVPISGLYETPKNGYLRLCFAKDDKQLELAANCLNRI